MPSRNHDLHGSAPDTSPVVLLLVDVINDLEFDGGEALIEEGLSMARALAALKERARAAGIPAVYVNDNFGKWQSDFGNLIDHVIGDDTRGRPIAELLRPTDQDYFVLKPKHSAFYSTTLDTLLDYLGAKALIITGMAGNICVLFTASDAYMRDFFVLVPADCIASESSDLSRQALRQMESVLKADTTDSSALDLDALLREHRG